MQGDSPEQKSMERTYSRSQCGGPRAAMPAIGPGPGNIFLMFSGYGSLRILYGITGRFRSLVFTSFSRHEIFLLLP